MKLHLQDTANNYRFTAYGDDYVSVNNVAYKKSLIITPNKLDTEWNVAGFEQLREQNFEFLLTFKAEILLLGTGRKMRFPHPGLYRSVIAAGIGLETMDTHAACRTYNILMGEGRRVAAAIIVD
jgi:uncharacterized protein